MILTEEEARTKWCPEVRFVIGPNTPTWQGSWWDSRGETGKPPLCIASNCMMWRWFDTSDPVKASTGYCGKAGKP